jgi:hypothetical protein
MTNSERLLAIKRRLSELRSQIVALESEMVDVAYDIQQAEILTALKASNCSCDNIEHDLGDRSNALQVSQTSKASDFDYTVFQDVWNSDRPSHWAKCESLNKKRIAELKKFTRENGDRSLEIFQLALEYARSDDWCNKPNVKFTIDNFMTNNKPVSWAEKQRSCSTFDRQSEVNRLMNLAGV